jgi:hypothetical protein
MAMTTPCPNCGTPVELDRSALKVAVCPGCRAVLRSQTAAASLMAAGWQTTSIVLKWQFAMLLILLLGTAASFGPLRFGPGDNGAAVCVGGVLLLVYFLCLCLCASAPDPTASRSALACVLTVVFGTVGLIAFTVFLTQPGFLGLPRPLIETGLGLGFFAVYYAAFVFLVRFHAAVARRFGDRRLRLHCIVYLFVPLVSIAVNFGIFWLTEPFHFGIVGPVLFGPPRDLAFLVQTVFNFAVVVWYAIMVWRTFRTIDRGPAAAPGSSDGADDDLPDLPID